jgi:hypothetical protein
MAEALDRHDGANRAVDRIERVVASAIGRTDT